MPLDSAQSVNARGWSGLLWDGCEVAILASGESLRLNDFEQCEAVRAWRERSPDARKVIAINTTFRRALWADVLYACDGAWWEGRDRSDMSTYGEEAKATFHGELWTQDAGAAKKYGVKFIQSAPGHGLELGVGKINQGANGGYQAIGLAYQSGAHRVYLLGYDMRGGHWHGNHPGMLHRNQRFDLFLKNLAGLARDVEKRPDFEVINCTPKSALRAFPMRPWQEVFA